MRRRRIGAASFWALGKPTTASGIIDLVNQIWSRPDAPPIRWARVDVEDFLLTITHDRGMVHDVLTYRKDLLFRLFDEMELDAKVVMKAKNGWSLDVYVKDAQ